MASTWSQNGNSITEQSTGVTRNYGTKADQGITATGNINKTPGLGLTQGGELTTTQSTRPISSCSAAR